MELLLFYWNTPFLVGITPFFVGITPFFDGIAPFFVFFFFFHKTFLETIWWSTRTRMYEAGLRLDREMDLLYSLSIDR